MNDSVPRNENPDLLLGNLSQLPEQRFANSEFSIWLLHVEVLELHTWSDRARSGSIRRKGTDIYSWPARPRREVEEIERETEGFIRLGQGQ